MCTELVLIALEAGAMLPKFDGGGVRPCSDDPASLDTLIERYMEAGRHDAERAGADERRARMRLFAAEQQRVEVSRRGDAARTSQAVAAVEVARTSMVDAAIRCTQARSDCAFAEARIQRTVRAIGRRPRLGGQALRAFALERLRQLDEIADRRGPDRPSRDRVLLDRLRRSLRELRLVANP